jgi:hypothetical protein
MNITKFRRGRCWHVVEGAFTLCKRRVPHSVQIYDREDVRTTVGQVCRHCFELARQGAKK